MVLSLRWSELSDLDMFSMAPEQNFGRASWTKVVKQLNSGVVNFVELLEL
jgi:hypothetical protein